MKVLYPDTDTDYLVMPSEEAGIAFAAGSTFGYEQTLYKGVTLARYPGGVDILSVNNSTEGHSLLFVSGEFRLFGIP